jgi:hypothetical protein
MNNYNHASIHTSLKTLARNLRVRNNTIDFTAAYTQHRRAAFRVTTTRLQMRLMAEGHIPSSSAASFMLT